MIICTDAFENLYAKVVYKQALFTSNTAIITSFLQNLIGNLLNVKLIVDKVTIADASGDTVTTWTEYGKIARLMLDFDPIEEATLRSSSV